MPGPAAFRTTHWSVVIMAGQGDPENRKKHLNDLIQAYWRPIFRTIRFAWGKRRHEAEDLTQGFFTYLLEKALIEEADPERGRFRTYLRAVLRRYLADTEKFQRRIKRGGGAPTFKFDFSLVPEDRSNLRSRGQTPEEVFEREWAACVVESAIGQVREHLDRVGKQTYFEIFQAYDMDPGEKPPGYREIAARFKVSESDVLHYLHYVRSRLRERLRALVRETVQSDSEVEEEIDHVINQIR
jgi:RNA polymerase sigma-70 factor (ECF subfamily)